ncbi:MAG: hypothetical protein HY074_20850 [Deltaproteobacteria bacterium]|nr:hypothetical protein [Deltaproteobacteria bacterium]
MSNPKSILALAMALGFFGLLGAQAHGNDVTGDADAPQAKHTAKKAVKLKAASRGLASLSAKSTAQMGQGEQMLYSLKTTSPRFLKTAKSDSKVRIAGVCREVTGMTYNSTEKGYGDCLDAKTEGSSSVNEYFGSAQRHAGVGILVGN